MATISTTTLAANGFTFDCRTAGDPNATQKVLLLHGWPETNFMWEGLMLLLADNGFYCVAPNQRGFSSGARPKGKENYELKLLAEDAVAIAKAAGFDRFHLVSHDWGSVIGWSVLELNRELIISYSSLSVPHMKAFVHALINDPNQRQMSLYVRLFQIPLLPELLFLAFNAWFLRRRWSHHTEAHVEAYLEVLGKRKALNATLNYYRANYNPFVRGETPIEFGDVSIPTLMRWGKDDGSVSRESVEMGAQFMTGDYDYKELDASHWLMVDDFEGISADILGHLQKYSAVED